MQGDYPFTFKWFFNNRPIYYKTRAKVTQVNRRSSNMVIEAVNAKDMGNYTCVVTNRAGTSSTTAILTVKGLFKNKFI